MIRDIVIWPAPTLDSPAAQVSDPKATDIVALGQDLVDTCSAVGGFGLAAPQIGVGLRVFVLNMEAVTGDASAGYEVFVNPTFVETEGEELMEEGCLSLPGVHASVKRATSVVMEYTSVEGTQEVISGKGLLAQALQHEVDHLNGTVVVRRGPRFKMTDARRRMSLLKKRMQQRKLSYSDVIKGGSER